MAKERTEVLTSQDLIRLRHKTCADCGKEFRVGEFVTHVSRGTTGSIKYENYHKECWEKRLY